MFIIKAVTDIQSRIISNNIAEDPATEYDADATYTYGDVRKVTAAGTVYKCIASNATINNETVPVKGLYPPDYLVSNNTTGYIYPWMELRAINSLAAFDKYINTQATSDDGVDFQRYVFKAGGCDSLALFNIAAKSATLRLYNNSGVLLSEETKLTYKKVFTLDDYFFTEVEHKTSLMFSFGLGLGGTIELTIKNDGATAKCGMIALGRKYYLGSTKDEVNLAITDYSKYETDTLGRVSMSKGNYSDTSGFTLYMNEAISNKKFYDAKRILVSCRGERDVWCIDNTDKTWETNPELMIYGYPTDWAFVRRNGMSTCDMKLAGVV